MSIVAKLMFYRIMINMDGKVPIDFCFVNFTRQNKGTETN